jgi:hypothetical protein
MNIISIDIEADGPCPGVNSMLQLGAYAFTTDGQGLEGFQANLELQEGCIPDPATMSWWLRNNKSYERTRIATEHPKWVMTKFHHWLSRFDNVVALAYPSGFDFPWVYYYLHKHFGRSIFQFQCIDIKSTAAAILGVPYQKATKKHMPKAWFESLPKHTHEAMQDAKEQGMLYFNMLRLGKGVV